MSLGDVQFLDASPTRYLLFDPDRGDQMISHQNEGLVEFLKRAWGEPPAWSSPPRVLMTDRGVDYLSQELADHLREAGISHWFLGVGRPNPAERRWDLAS